jgi:sugar phosphate isomerase/epimerase
LIVLSTGSLYSYGVDRAFRLAADLGFDGMEVIVDDRIDSREPAYLRRLVAGHGLPIRALHAPFAFDVPRWPDDQLSRLQRTVELAQELEVPVVVTHLPFRVYAISVQWNGTRTRRWFLPVPGPRREPYYHLLRDGALSDLEVRSGVTIAVENMPARRLLGVSLPLYWFNSPLKMRRFAHVTLDTTHVGTWGWDLLETYAQFEGRVAHVHLSNFDGREHRAPADGHLPLGDLLRRLSADRYPGAVSIESNPQALSADDSTRCRAALAEALAFCRRHMGVAA